MRTPPRARTLALAGIASLTLVAAACGGDDDDATPATSGAAPTMAPTTMAPTTEPAASSAAMMSPTGPACDAVPASGDGSFSGMADDPAATAASNNPELTTLVSAVEAAGLVDTLNGAGPFTIFAPVNAAFDEIPAADLDGVLADEALLTSILTYHVVAGQMSGADLAAAGTVTTVNGADLTITESDGALTINGEEATVVCQDVPTANATVHLIDAVLMPPSDDATMSSTPAEDAMMAPSGPACASVPSGGEGSFAGMADDPVATAASNNPELTTLVAAVQAAGLVDTLNTEGPLTVFAPVNSAFAKIPTADLDAVLADPDQLTAILAYHVVPEQLSSEELATVGSVTTVNGAELTIEQSGDTLMLDGDAATVVCQDIPTANATVYLIDSVLLPPA